MSDVVIRAENLTMVYRLYAKPSYRFLDMFGLLGGRSGAYREHAALDGVTLEIRRGEKVAIIGRNGAGKSTLLKIITRVVQPTAGVIDVTGQVQALLQIGTGFHPDFTGRDNVMAYFAQLGIVGPEAARWCEDAIAFAELEEYVDQPIKTYSTGMALRLMFAASTAITPDLLVLDEVLGVGDAYFAHKSYERIRELCDQNGATAVLVTHDIYSAAKMCSRVIWIDCGRVLFDGDAPSALKAYEDSVRQQEESRLRVRKRSRLRALAMAEAQSGRTPMLVEIACAAGRSPAPVYFGAIELTSAGESIAALPLDASPSDDETVPHLQAEGTAWSEATEWRGRPSRGLLNYGSPFLKVAGTFDAPADVLDRKDLSIEFDAASDATATLTVRAFVDDHELDGGVVTVEAADWRRHHVRLARRAASADAATVNVSGVQGTGSVIVRNAAFVDDDGREVLLLEHGRPVALDIAYRVVDPSLSRHAQVVVAWHRNGVQDVCRFFARDIRLDCDEGTMRLSIGRLTLTDGRYTITIMLTEPGYYDREQTTFYALSPGVYCCLSRLFEVEVVNSGLVGTGTVAVVEGTWSVHA